MAGMHSLDELLHKSKQQLIDVAGPDPAFPPIQRSLDQLEALSRQLKARSSRLDTAGETTAATRLLAREGINAEQLTRDLRSFELKTTFEDVFPIEASSVEEYLAQVHEMAMLASIQSTHRSAVASASDYMQRWQQEEWDHQKRDFLHALSRMPPPAPSSSSAAFALGPTPSAARGRYSGDMSAPSTVASLADRQQALTAGGGIGGSSERAAAYAAAVWRMNAALQHRTPFKVAGAMREACESTSGAEGSATVSMSKIWSLLEAMVDETGPAAAAAGGEAGTSSSCGNRRAAMIRGARRHLEEGHARHMLQVIHSHSSQAALGGSTANLQRVRAFLRVRLREQGALDFDAELHPRQPPLDTTWHQIYACVRSGFYEEALQVAQTARASRSFAPKLAEWVQSGGQVSAGTAQAVAEECERMARAAERQGGGRGAGAGPAYDKKRMLVHALVCGGARQLSERVQRDVPVLFATIQDFLWFKLATLSPSLSQADEAGGGLFGQQGQGQGQGGGGSLGELQAYLKKFGAAYYTKGGKDPLVYAYVLLLSLQLPAAVRYLVKDAPAPFQLDGVHVALALAVSGALFAAATTTSSSSSSLTDQQGGTEECREIAAMVRHYGATYLRNADVALALEYYAAAAAALGGGAAGSAHAREQRLLLDELLKEILRVPAGAELLLGRSGMSDGSLGRFVEGPEERRQLVMSAAHSCHDAGRYDEAVDLLKRSGAYGGALSIVVRRLSQALASLAHGASQQAYEKASAMLAAGSDIVDAYRSSGGGSSSSASEEQQQVAQQQAAFRQLEAMLRFYRAAHGGKFSEALRELSALPFLPLDGRSADACSDALRSVARPVEERVPELLEGVVACLDRLPASAAHDSAVRATRIQIVNLVASSLHRNWPQDVYERVARMHALPLH